MPVHYYASLLYRRDLDNNIHGYVGTRNFAEVYCRIADPLWTPILRNKILTDLFFRQTDIRLPRLMGFNVRNQFIIGNDVISASDRGQLQDLLVLCTDTSPTASIFAKPAGGGAGVGCFKFDSSDVSTVCAKKGLDLLNSDYVYQEVIAQHPKMAELNPSSVNSLRIDTYRTDQGKVDVMSALVRMGADGRCIDNVTAGGCFVGVDLESGTLRRKGFMFPEKKPAVLVRHPDTGVAFHGFEVPFLSEAIMVAKRAAELIPISVAGWDVAISDHGPVLIEGNENYSSRMSEMAYGGYWRNPVFRQLVMDHAPEMAGIGRHFDRILSHDGN